MAGLLIEKKIINDLWLVPREQMNRTRKAIDSGVSRLQELDNYLDGLINKVITDPNKIKDLISKQLRVNSNYPKLYNVLAHTPDEIASIYLKRFNSLYQLQEVVDKDIIKVYNIREFTRFESKATNELSTQIKTISDIELDKITDAYNTTISRYPLVSALCHTRHVWDSSTVVDALNYMENIDNGYFANY